jgi:predicted secreted protein
VRSQQESNSIVPGSDPGAPAKPRLGKKLLINTVLAIILWGVADWAYLHYYVAAR